MGSNTKTLGIVLWFGFVDAPNRIKRVEVICFCFSLVEHCMLKSFGVEGLNSEYPVLRSYYE